MSIERTLGSGGNGCILQTTQTDAENRDEQTITYLTHQCLSKYICGTSVKSLQKYHKVIFHLFSGGIALLYVKK